MFIYLSLFSTFQQLNNIAFAFDKDNILKAFINFELLHKLKDIYIQ